jgi:hypothetical protein
VHGYDAGGNYVAAHDVPFAGTGNWVFVTETFTASPNEVSAQIQGTSSQVGTFWFDDLSLTPSNNVITNGGFEVGSAGWTLAPQVSIDTNPADAHSGNNSAQLVSTGPWQVIRQAFAVTPGKAYTFTGWGRSNIVGGYLIVRGYDAAGNAVASLDLPVAGTGSWVSVTGIHIAASNEVSVQVQATSSISGTFWFDDLSLTAS